MRGRLRGPSASELAERHARWAKTILGVVLIGLGGVKLAVGSSEGESTVGAGLGALVDSDPARIVAGVVEFGLGLLALVKGRQQNVLVAIGLWVATIAGVFAALVIRGVPLSECACLGGISASPLARGAILVGLVSLLTVAIMGAPGGRRRGYGERPATGAGAK